jgi:hypothetical protein
MKVFLGLIFIFIIISASGQSLNGLVLERETELPISYVSIGIINKPGGTYSDTDGMFHFKQAEFDRTDSLKFSCIGYKSVSFSLTELIEKYGNESLKIYMEKEVFKLKGVDIFPHEYKVSEIGNKISNRHICICGSNDVEGGIVIRNRKKIFLDKLTFKLSSECSLMPDSVLFRFNIYTINNDLPAELILVEPIYFRLSKELSNDKITVDLEKYRIAVTGDFAATIEIIKSYGTGKICFAGWITGSPTVFKYGKQGKWAYPADDKKTKVKIYQSMVLTARIEK